MTRILTNREWEPRGRKDEEKFSCLYVFLSTEELCHVARLQKQADALLAMEEDEEVHFKRPDTVPDTPRVSRTNSPDREEEDDREVKDYAAVL